MSDIIWKSFKVDPADADWEPATYNVKWQDGREYGRWRRVLRKDPQASPSSRAIRPRPARHGRPSVRQPCIACRWSSYRSACLVPGTSQRITECSVRGCPTLSDEPILRPDVDDRRVRVVLGRIVNVTTDILDGRIVLDLVGRGRF